MIQGKLAKLLVLAATMMMTACVGTRQISYDTAVEEIPGISRTVQYELKDSLFEAAPRCVTVMAIDTLGKPYTYTHKMVEEAVARHLGGRFNKVVSPFERDNLTRTMAVDLNHPTDRKAYARNTRCKFFVELTPITQGNTYLLFWSQSALGLEVRLTDVSGESILWKARHIATRSDGGLPLSPVSAAYSAFSASLLAEDSDVPYSLADDLARRLTATLPDMRQADQIAIYN